MARKKRQYLQQEQTQEPVSAMLPSVWETAIYARLSVENSKKNDDGDSIEGQIEICRDYVAEHPYLHLADTYVDNGWTGTNTDRPEFQRLLSDIREGKIKALVIKDFSRFSRDYIEAGNLLENIFPAMGVRFISVVDRYDSFETDGSASSLLFFLLIAMGLYRSPAVALMPDLTPKPLRSQANAIINLMGAVGGIYTLILISLLLKGGDKPDYTPVFLGVALLMVVAVVLLVLTVREKKLAQEVAKANLEEETEEEQKADKTGELTPGVKRSLTMILISIFLWFTAYNAVTTAFSRYARTVWGMGGGGFANCLMVATVAAIISYIPIGMISAKVGRKKTIMGGLVLMLISFFAAIFFTEYHAVINLGFALIGMGWAAVSVNSLPMVVEMCSSEDVGKYTGLYYTFSMSAQIVTPILSGAFLQYVSYRTLFPYACVFTVAAMITMSMVHHGDNKPERKKNLLENFDVED